MAPPTTTTAPELVAPTVAPPNAQPTPEKGLRWRLVFLWPLLFTGLMMTLDTPLANAVITRLPGAETALAALVVAFSLALVYESPHVAMLEIATALTTSRQALYALRRFYLRMALVVGAAGALIVFSPIYDVLLLNVMNIPADVTAVARPALAVFLLWPLPIGWRRLHQGALIRYGYSRAVGAGATVRILTLGVALLVLGPTLGGWVGGAAIGALAMLLSVTTEAVYNERAAIRLLTEIPATDPTQPPLQFRNLWEYFWPLAGTSALSTINRPLTSAGIAAAAIASADPIGQEGALAAFGVAWAIVFLINGGTLTLWPVAISWDNNPDHLFRRRGMFTLLAIGGILSAVLALIAFTPALDLLLGAVYVVSGDIAAAATPVVRLLIPVPFLFACSGVLRGKLINLRQPRAVRRAQIVDLLTLSAVFLIGINWPDLATRPHGATLGALAALITYTVDLLVLLLLLRSMRHLAIRRV